jgi:FKBP-type peptidyl-prolyl cis-trans isomerase
MQKFLLILITLFSIATAKAQFIKLQSGIEYRYIKKGKGTQTAKVGDYVSMIIKSTCSGQLLFDSKNYNKGINGPVNFPLQKPMYNGDVNGVVKLLHEGDSVIVKIPQDSFYRVPQAQRKGIVAGEPVIYNIGVYSIKTAAQLKKLQDDYKKSMAEFAKQQAIFKKQQEDQLKLQKKQAAIDKKQDQELIAYFAKNNIANAKKLPSGVYVCIDSEGAGELIKPGFEVSMNYENQGLTGTKFDSNIDSAFNHVTPKKVIVRQGQLLTGWDEGIQQFKKGGKGKIFIPSKLAYGTNKFALNSKDSIPSNSIIRIDLEILDVVDAALLAKQMIEKEDGEIQAFLKTNNLTATKTNSGLYYIITQEGTGGTPAPGDEVNMNYTGMYLDGKKFDSNVDSSFNHVTPLVFPLGQGRVIPGWDEGIQLLKKGTKAKFIIPSRIGYGTNGKGNIAPNTIMQFDVELLDFKKAEIPKK